MTRGQLVVVEGLEGAGKSTAITTLQGILQEHGLDMITTREPGGTILGETVRSLLKQTSEEAMDPRAELLLFYAARVQLLETVIKPALAKGTWVLADRCDLSSFAYQGGGRGMSELMLQRLSEFCVGHLQPDLLFYLDISPEIGLQRAKDRGMLDRIEQESIHFFNDVHAAYHRYLKRMPAAVFIDACQPLINVQEALKVAMNHYLNDHYVSA
ncbi:MAG: dTMP kinase [Legionella sp.]|nr:MAG: dTMP kinase [Legionella sp.]